MQSIIYPNNQCLSLLTPTQEAVDAIGFNAIALKDVPAGVPFLIIDEDQIPLHFHGAWEADFSTPDGYGADYGAGSLNEVVGWTEDGAPVIQEPQ